MIVKVLAIIIQFSVMYFSLLNYFVLCHSPDLLPCWNYFIHEPKTIKVATLQKHERKCLILSEFDKGGIKVATLQPHTMAGQEKLWLALMHI